MQDLNRLINHKNSGYEERRYSTFGTRCPCSHEDAMRYMARTESVLLTPRTENLETSIKPWKWYAMSSIYVGWIALHGLRLCFIVDGGV